ncbi:MAG TPA: response regulator [Smithellaceae bacterium]|jgi:phosphate regulon transcriptional regulator PhoB|nr:response regulator [Smithellaceae bacterium]HQQ88261.1 response regulator [Smithellaceae bacterium]
MSRILIVDDEQDIVELISYNLEKEGFSCVKAYDGETALKLAKTKKPELIILDLMLPKINGLDVCRAIRHDPVTANIPIIMLTAKVDEVDKILGLEIGADDYMTKPFSVKELVARVRTILRRLKERGTTLEESFKYKGLEINYASCSVKVDGKKIDLSPTELKLLFFLSRNPGRVYSRNQILDHVWGDDTFVTDRTVDVHIRRLRSQIEKDIENPRYILTIRGFGYKFTETR